MNWKSIVIWSLIILAGTYTVAIVGALTMVSWEMYGQTLEEAVVNSRLVRLAAYFVVDAALFWRFASSIRARRLLHVLAAYILVQVVDLGVSMLLDVTSRELFDPWAVGRGLLAAALGLGLASLISDKRLRANASASMASER